MLIITSLLILRWPVLEITADGKILAVRIAGRWMVDDPEVIPFPTPMRPFSGPSHPAAVFLLSGGQPA